MPPLSLVESTSKPRSSSSPKCPSTASSSATASKTTFSNSVPALAPPSPSPINMAALSPKESIEGLLFGTAVGDALGLPAEGLSPGRIQRRWRDEWRMRLCFGRGMVSDDTENTIMVAQSLLFCPDDPARFQRRLASKLRWWLLALPAGVGFATARAILKSWCGIPPSRSGVHSAGNGPAMRAAITGAFFAFDPVKRRQFTSAATRLTHVDERAEI